MTDKSAVLVPRRLLERAYNLLPVSAPRREIDTILKAAPVSPPSVVDREAVARIIDPAAFLFTTDELGVKDFHHPARAALAKADAILALIASSLTGEG